MKKIIYSLIVLVSILGFSHNVFATTIVSQDDSSVRIDGQSYINQQFGTGLTGSLKNIYVYASQGYNEDGTVNNTVRATALRFNVQECTSNDYSICTTITQFDLTQTFTNQKALFIGILTSPYTLISNKWYFVQLQARYTNVSDNFSLYGTSTFDYPNGFYCKGYSYGYDSSCSSTGSYSSTSKSIYFALTDDNGISTCSDGIQNQDELGIDWGGVCGNPTDYIYGSSFQMNFYNPSSGNEISTGSNVESIFGSTVFKVQGINPYGAYDLIHIDILEDDSIISTKDYAISTISDTLHTYVNTDLQSLADASTTPFVYDYGKKYTFNILVSGQLIQDESNFFNLSGYLYYGLESACTDTLDFICYFKKWINWVFVPSQEVMTNFSSLTLANSIPFSYLYDMGNLYEELFPDDPQSINIATAFGQNELTLLSTEQLEAIPFQSTIRTIVGLIMVFSIVMLLYRRIMHIHDKEEIKTNI
jgi:hypothetical protein